jgi:uncharacterized protein (TIGR00255 family)
MTGFGRAVSGATPGGGRLVVEIRSVNHRGVDVKVRARDVDAACEIEIIRAVRAAVERGAVTVNVREDATSSALPVDRLRALHGMLETLRQEMGLPGRVDLATVAAYFGVVAGEGAAGASWEALRPAVEEALRALTAARAEEGAALLADLRARLARLGGLVRSIAAAAATLPTRAARRLEERVAALAASVPLEPARLAQEVALLAERLDVSEEVVRLQTHLAHLERLLAGSAAAGRKMDFVIQEIGRELNTVGAKVQDAEVAGLVIEGKAELEKIREQAQNIE